MPSQTFSAAGRWQTFNVPKGVDLVTVRLDGAGSGGVGGGRVTGSIRVTDRQTLYIAVGEAGVSPNGETPGGTTFGGGGAGGAGRGGKGGHGGGGASFIRINSTSGAIRAVAGGAGGFSGDGGGGGLGGGDIGQNGFPGTSGTGLVGNATGGTQIQGGNGGTSALGPAYVGGEAGDVPVSRGGAGGSTRLPNTVGGGGGGGGYHPGGGGQAGLVGVAPAGGGAGGSNYHGGLVSWSSAQGIGGVGDGEVVISWSTPPPANQPPSPPTEAKVNDVDAVDEMSTQSMSSVTITATLDDPSKSQKVKMAVQWSTEQNFSSGTHTTVSGLVGQTKRAKVTLTGLVPNTHYFVRLFTRDDHNLQSLNFNSVNFWTNRRPTEPILVAPIENATYSQLASVPFQWTHQDPDPGSVQGAFTLKWRRAGSATADAGPWHQVQLNTYATTWVADPGTFNSNDFYEWQVRTRDSQGIWGPFSEPQSFYITGVATAPIPVGPVKGEAVDITKPVALRWRFRDPDQGDYQTQADLRIRAIGSTDWVTYFGTGTVPGSTPQWTLTPETLEAGVHYEWQVRTTDHLSSATSDWSESEHFWSIRTPGEAVADNGPVPGPFVIQEPLGVGRHRVFLYDRGGRYLRGEITDVASLTWGRKRDDISNCTISTNGWGSDDGALIRGCRSWAHEVVVFRDSQRVWEGPLVRKAETAAGWEMEAKDVMNWVYRRIMRQGYNDSYRLVNGVVQGQMSVVQRAQSIIVNALAPDDPNILPFLTAFVFADDAGQSRVVEDYAKTAWEEVDDMAANAGLDYTVVGRRIILNDTHRPVGRLPELRDENFTNAPIITEYGMQAANHYGVTNNNGVFGFADRPVGPEGVLEMLASAFGETDAGSDQVLTSSARAELEQTLSDQAERNIAHRWPTPIVVRVPDNSTLTPDTNLDINQLVPGVWIPLRAKRIAQWQKLDEVAVTVGADGAEQIQVTLSPAPNGGEDPDADTTGTDDISA